MVNKAGDKIDTQCSIANTHITVNLAIKGLAKYQTAIKPEVLDIVLLPRYSSTGFIVPSAVSHRSEWRINTGAI